MNTKQTGAWRWLWGTWMLACLFLGGVPPTQASEERVLVGRVVAVTDGDTVTLLVAGHEQHKVRIGGIDAPEKSQPFGQRSRQSLSDLLMDRSVQAQARKRDRYGRWVATVWVDGTDAGLRQIQRGMGWHYKAYEKEQPQAERVAYAEAEDLARARRVGLWADRAPVPPWDYRKARRQ
jgi:endonuclease YncB( thermonuclease family)